MLLYSSTVVQSLTLVKAAFHTLLYNFRMQLFTTVSDNPSLVIAIQPCLASISLSGSDAGWLHDVPMPGCAR